MSKSVVAQMSTIGTLHDPKMTLEPMAVIDSGCTILPKRWAVERIHAWTECWHRTAMHRERKIAVSATWACWPRHGSYSTDSLISVDFSHTCKNAWKNCRCAADRKANSRAKGTPGKCLLVPHVEREVSESIEGTQRVRSTTQRHYPRLSPHFTP